jgi:hypothetical protein
VSLKARGKQASVILGTDIASERDGWNVAAGHFSRSDVADERIAVVVGHPDIADQHVRSEAVEGAQRSTH